MKLRRIPVIGRQLAGITKVGHSVVRRIKLRRYQSDMFDAEETATWSKSGLDPVRGRLRLDDTLRALNRRPFDAARDSIHWLLAASIEQRLEPECILELGTYDGEFTAILASLYPRAEIVTVDLPQFDPLLRSFYGRKKQSGLQRELAARAGNLKRSNISSININTFFLLDVVRGPFDVIWVDAGHNFPDVAWDLCHAFHLAKPGGIILADDVGLEEERVHWKLSPDAQTVLRYVAERMDAPIYYFLKRRNEAAFLYQKEYVAWCQKPSVWPPTEPKPQQH